MIVAANVCKAATTAVIATLAISSGRNMLQTRQLCRERSSPVNIVAKPMISVDDLQSMSRKELMQLYLHKCKAPTDLSELEGNWNGHLLANNGLVRSHCNIGSGLATFSSSLLIH